VPFQQWSQKTLEVAHLVMRVIMRMADVPDLGHPVALKVLEVKLEDLTGMFINHFISMLTLEISKLYKGTPG